VRRAKLIRSTLLALFVGAVAFGIGVILNLSERVESIQTAEQSDPLWVGSQLQFEMLRLERELSHAALGIKPTSDVALRFNIAWSRIYVLQQGKLAKIIEQFDVDKGVLHALDRRFQELESHIVEFSTQDMTDVVRRRTAEMIVHRLEGYDFSLRNFLLDLAQAKTSSLSDFRSGLLSLSHTIAYLGVTILAIFGIFISLLMVELRLSGKREREMEILVEEANSVSRMKSNFMSVVSHELRTPLTSIIGGLALLQAKVDTIIDDKTVHQLLDVARRNGDRLLTLVNDILDAQALSEGKVSINKVTTDLNQVVRDTVESCQPYAVSRGVSYDVIIPPDETLANTDAPRVSQVLNNFLSNAAKFTQSGDVVEVRLRRLGDKARVEVSDNGIGIPVEAQNDIFNAFQQVNPGTTGPKKSSGLGLSIAKQLMELLDGNVGFRSIEGEGSTFWMEIDLVS
jgi:signal transduction histidine kinase